jgi:hypothetical protein
MRLGSNHALGRKNTLGKFAEKHKHDGLADIFRASAISWCLVARQKADIGNET